MVSSLVSLSGHLAMLACLNPFVMCCQECDLCLRRGAKVQYTAFMLLSELNHMMK